MHRRGFTIIELVTVIALIIILAYLAIMSYGRAKANSKLSRVSADLEEISQSVSEYVQDNNYQYPPDVDRGVPPGLEKYLQGGTWPTSVWPHGVFDWDNILVNGDGPQAIQITYRLCDTVANPNEPLSDCADPLLFPHFTQYSSIFYCIFGPCVPHQYHPTDPGFCVNCKVKPQNPPL